MEWLSRDSDGGYEIAEATSIPLLLASDEVKYHFMGVNSEPSTSSLAFFLISIQVPSRYSISVVECMDKFRGFLFVLFGPAAQLVRS